MQQQIPGTNIPYPEGRGVFSVFVPLIQATDGLTLSQVCTLTCLEPSTIQNWVKRGFVSRPVNKKYRERQLARILLISSLKGTMQIEKIGQLLARVNGDANDTGDDIISEEQMYDYFCEAVAATGESGMSAQDIQALVLRVTADYVPRGEKAAQRLRASLSVMVCAYIAGEYKKAAERLFAETEEL